MTITDAIKKIIELKGLEIFKNYKLFFSFLSDLSPEYQKERKIIKNNFDERILELFIDENKKPAQRLRWVQIKLDDAGLAKDWIDFIIESFGLALGWENEVQDLKINAPILTNTPQIQHQKQIVNTNFQDVTLNDDVLKQLGYLDKKEIQKLDVPSNYETYNGLSFRITNIENELFKNCEKLQSVIIPDTIKEIGNSAFENCRSLKKINIPDSVIKIGYRAFVNCRSLNNITIPDSVIKIGSKAFGACTSLINITLSNNITKIEEGLFANCKSLINIIIPNGVTEIENLAFIGCESLSGILLPKTLTKIGGKAFANCKSLDNIIIPNSVKNIGIEAFAGCAKIQQFTLPTRFTIFKDDVKKNIIFTSKVQAKEPQQSNNYSYYDFTAPIEVTLDDNVLAQLGYIVNNGILTKTIKKNDQNVTVFNIPATYKYNGREYKITKIADNAFLRCSFLENVTIPDTVKIIGEESFRGCTSLKKLAMGNGVVEIKKCAFAWCNSLIDVTISNKLTKISSNAFALCTSLTNIIIPNSVTKIETFAFSMCNSLKKLVIPDSVNSIGENAFFNVQHIYYHGTAIGAPWGAKAMN